VVSFLEVLYDAFFICTIRTTFPVHLVLVLRFSMSTHYFLSLRSECYPHHHVQTLKVFSWISRSLRTLCICVAQWMTTIVNIQSLCIFGCYSNQRIFCVVACPYGQDICFIYLFLIIIVFCAAVEVQFFWFHDSYLCSILLWNLWETESAFQVKRRMNVVGRK